MMIMMVMVMVAAFDSSKGFLSVLEKILTSIRKRISTRKNMNTNLSTTVADINPALP